MIENLQKYIILFVVALLVFSLWIAYGGKKVDLYFATKDAMGLKVEERRVKGDLMEEALLALIAGPKNPKLSPTLPPGVEILNIKMRDETCVVNFSETIVTHHWGGSTGELLTVYSIVNTLTQFPGVEYIQILVEGRKVETLAGHLILDESLEANMDLVQN